MSRRSSSKERLRQLVAWGVSNYGQIGQTDLRERPSPVVVTGLDAVASFAAGGSHNVVIKLTEDKQAELYAWGRNDSHQCGTADDQATASNATLSPQQHQFTTKFLPIPTPIATLNLQRIVQVSCGGAHSGAVSASGKVFTWGWGSYGQLGIRDAKEQPTPREVSDLSDLFVVSIICGGFHTAFLTKTHSVYTTGMGTYGQLGHGDTENKTQPTLVEDLQDKKVSTISCGEAVTAALTSTGECYTWGSGDSWQLGHGDKVHEKSPRVVEYFQENSIPIIKISCAARHTVAISEAGHLYTWGTGEQGELGLGPDERIKSLPTVVDSVGSLTWRNLTSSVHFTGAVTDMGEVYVWGGRLIGSLSTSTTPTIFSTPRKFNVMSELFAVQIQAGTSHALAFVDSGEQGRNKLIGKIIAAETKYFRGLHLLCKVITPVAEAIVSQFTWSEIIGKLMDVYKYHKKLLAKLRKIVQPIEPYYDISEPWLALFTDSSLLQCYTEYGTKFAASWESAVTCLKLLPGFGAYLERAFSSDVFVHSGLFKARNAEQLQALLQLPTHHFAELAALLQDLLKATKRTSPDYSNLKKVAKKAQEAGELVQSSMQDRGNVVMFLHFLNTFPSCRNLIQSHRRLIDSWKCSLREKGHMHAAVYLFNDIIIITHEAEVEEHLELFQVFIRNLPDLPSRYVFQIVAPLKTINIYVESASEKERIMNYINEAALSWLAERPRLKDARILSGISTLVADLNNIMPLINKDWQFATSPTPTHSLSKASGAAAVKKLQSEIQITKNQSKIVMSLQDIGDLLSRTSGALESEGLRRERQSQLHIAEFAEQTERFVVEMELVGAMKAKGSSVTKAFTKRKKGAPVLLTNLGLTSSVPVLNKNYRVAVRVTGGTRIEAAKEMLYTLAKESPWASSASFPPMSDFVLRIKSLNFVLHNESLPLYVGGRIPLIQTIYTTTFVTPTIEMILKPKDPQSPRILLESTLKTFEDLTTLLGATKSLLNTRSEEINFFRHVSGSFRMKLYAERNTQMRDSIYRFPEYKGLEPLPMQLPKVLVLVVYVPLLSNEKYALQVSPDDTISLINARIFRFVYKHEKHKGREKLKKFLKDIIKDTPEAEVGTDDSDTEVLADSEDDKPKTIEESKPSKKKALEIEAASGVTPVVTAEKAKGPEETVPASQGAEGANPPGHAEAEEEIVIKKETKKRRSIMGLVDLMKEKGATPVGTPETPKKSMPRHALAASHQPTVKDAAGPPSTPNPTITADLMKTTGDHTPTKHGKKDDSKKSADKRTESEKPPNDKAVAELKAKAKDPAELARAKAKHRRSRSDDASGLTTSVSLADESETITDKRQSRHFSAGSTNSRQKHESSALKRELSSSADSRFSSYHNRRRAPPRVDSAFAKSEDDSVHLRTKDSNDDSTMESTEVSSSLASKATMATKDPAPDQDHSLDQPIVEEKKNSEKEPLQHKRTSSGEKKTLKAPAHQDSTHSSTEKKPAEHKSHQSSPLITLPGSPRMTNKSPRKEHLPSATTPTPDGIAIDAAVAELKKPKPRELLALKGELMASPPSVLTSSMSMDDLIRGPRQKTGGGGPDEIGENRQSSLDNLKPKQAATGSPSHPRRHLSSDTTELPATAPGTPGTPRMKKHREHGHHRTDSEERADLPEGVELLRKVTKKKSESTLDQAGLTNALASSTATLPLTTNSGTSTGQDDASFVESPGSRDKKKKNTESPITSEEEDHVGSEEDRRDAPKKSKKEEEKLKRQQEERLRREKEKDERKIKKEEEKMKKLLEKEQKKAKKAQDKLNKMEGEKLRKELEKQGKKKIKQKHLPNSQTVDDFVLKVSGAKEYLLAGDKASPNRLCDYDYVCKAITNSTPIELIYIDRHGVVGPHVAFQMADLEDAMVDEAIARDTTENEITTIYLEPQQSSSRNKPFWSFADNVTEYTLNILDCENLNLLEDKARGQLFVAVGLYYGGQLLTRMQITPFVPTTISPSWAQRISFGLPMCDLPRESLLCFTVYWRADTSKSKNRIMNADQPLGWVNCQLFAHDGIIRSGLTALRLWERGHANPIGTMVDNVAADNPSILYIELYTNTPDTPNSTVRGSTVKPSKEPQFTTVRASHFIKPKERDATSEEATKLREIMHRDSLIPLSPEEKDLLWNNFYWCKKHPNIIPKLLLAVDWGNRSAVQHIHQELEHWPLLHPMDSIALLDYQYPDRHVRGYAVRCLEKINNNELYRILLQLTQALKYEFYHNSDLAHFLIKRSFHDPNRVGQFFFWQLRSEVLVPAISERYSLILESYLKTCGKFTRETLLAQADVLNKINSIALFIKNKKGSLSDKRDKLQKMLKSTEWPTRFMLPTDPRIECSGFVVEKCKVLGSKSVPLFLAIENAETQEAVHVIYKVGDDLRQDQLTLQIITLMDDLWKREGIDLKLKTYCCVALGDEHGLIEVVKNANTTSNINIELGGLRAVYSESTLVKWLRKHNPTDKQYQKAVETFVASCAGYSVITFVLGLADRHNDNIMLTKQGNLFHIDFGHFLGHYRKVFGKYVDKADIVLIDQYLAVIGKDNFPRFEKLCCKAYNVIRKHANYFIGLFSLMLSSGLPELESALDIQFMKERLRLELTDEAASEYFKRTLQESQDNSTIQWNHRFHVLYNTWRT